TLVPGRRRRGAGGRGCPLGVLDLAQPLLGQFGGALCPGLLGADRLQLARDLALLAFGFFLALALGQVDLFLAALLLLLARGLARGFDLALDPFLFAGVGLGNALLRLGLGFGRRRLGFGHRFRPHRFGFDHRLRFGRDRRRVQRTTQRRRQGIGI